MCFSSHSAAKGVMASAVNLRAISWIWSWSSVSSNWCMGAACRLRPRTQQDGLAGGLFLQQSFELQDMLRRPAVEDPLAEGGEVRAAFKAQFELLRPAR